MKIKSAFLLCSLIPSMVLCQVKKTVTTPAQSGCFPDINGAKANDTVTIHYTGRLKSDGTKFDSSIGGDPISFQLGIGRVIRGWDEGIVGSCLGEKFTLEIPSNLAYGPKGAGDVIPPNADLVFDCTLVGLDMVLHEETLVTKACSKDQRSRDKDIITFYYTGRIPNGTVFGSADRDSGAITIEIGKTGIKGWDEGLGGMCVGETKRVYIPPNLGYGEEGIEGAVPPNSVVYLDIELINIQDRVLSFLDRFSSGNFKG